MRASRRVGGNHLIATLAKVVQSIGYGFDVMEPLPLPIFRTRVPSQCHGLRESNTVVRLLAPSLALALRAGFAIHARSRRTQSVPTAKSHRGLRDSLVGEFAARDGSACVSEPFAGWVGGACDLTLGMQYRIGL